MFWTMKHPQATEKTLGYLPSFLSERDLRSVREQLDVNYCDGWRPFTGFMMLPDGNLAYPGDPPMRLLAEAKLRDEIIRLYECSWVAVIQPDGSYEIARMD